MRGKPLGDTADIVVVADIEQTRLDVSPCFAGEARRPLQNAPARCHGCRR